MDRNTAYYAKYAQAVVSQFYVGAEMDSSFENIYEGKTKI